MTISVAAAAPECMAFFSDAGGLTPKQYIAYSPMLQSCLCLKNLAKLYKSADSLIRKTHKDISQNVGKIYHICFYLWEKHDWHLVCLTSHHIIEGI
jgi:hypothetical protein